MSLYFQVEPWDDIKEELKPLYTRHWGEICTLRHESFPIELDEDRHAEMAGAGSLVIVTAREETKMVGYFAAMVFDHLMHRGVRFAFSEGYYLLPTFRKGPAGLQMFAFAEAEMRRRGVRKILTVNPFEHSNDLFLKRLGFVREDVQYGKVL